MKYNLHSIQVVHIATFHIQLK